MAIPVPVPPVNIGRRQTTSVPDSLVIPEKTRQMPSAAPLPLRESPSWDGDPAARKWKTAWVVRGLSNLKTGLDEPVPFLAEKPDGSVMIAYQGGLSSGPQPEDHLAIAKARRLDPDDTDTEGKRLLCEVEWWDGPRGQNYLPGHAAYVGLPRLPGMPPGTHWIGVSVQGWLFHLFADGSALSLAGPMTPLDVLPRLDGSRQVWRGDFDKPWSNCNGICVDVLDVGAVFVADGLNRRIARALHPAPHAVVQVRTHLVGAMVGGTISPFAMPIDVKSRLDGTLLVADRDLGRITEHARDGSSRLLGSNLGRITSLDLFSDGSVCYVDMNGKGSVWELAPDGSKHQICIAITEGQYKELLVDQLGQLGPVDDILVAPGGSGSNIFRVPRRGTDADRVWAEVGSSYRTGRLDFAGDWYGHYPQWIAKDPNPGQARLLFNGASSSGAILVERIQPGDPTTWPETERASINRGRKLWQTGTTAGGATLRPSLWHIHGPDGWGFVTGKGPGDVASMSSQDMLAWLHGGLGGSVPRPEMNASDAADVRAMLTAGSGEPPIGETPEPPDPGPEPPAEAPDVVVTLRAGQTWKVIGGTPA